MRVMAACSEVDYESLWRITLRSLQRGKYRGCFTDVTGSNYLGVRVRVLQNSFVGHAYLMHP